MAKIKVSKAKLLEAIRDARGMKTGICEILGIARATLDRYIEADEEVRDALETAKERDVDRAEYRLSEAIERGEAWAIQLKLKDHKRGKERGYGNSVDVTSGGEKIKGFIGWTPENWKQDEEK